MDTHDLINKLLESDDVLDAEDTSGITFKPHREGGYGGNRIQIAHMYLHGKYIGIERSYFPWSVFKEPKYTYYPDGEIYRTRQEADEAAAKWGGKAEKEPYEGTAFYLGFPTAELAVAYYKAVSGDPSDRRA